jgi:hypothetical protein
MSMSIIFKELFLIILEFSYLKLLTDHLFYQAKLCEATVILEVCRRYVLSVMSH